MHFTGILSNQVGSHDHHAASLKTRWTSKRPDPNPRVCFRDGSYRRIRSRCRLHGSCTIFAQVRDSLLPPRYIGGPSSSTLSADWGAHFSCSYVHEANCNMGPAKPALADEGRLRVMVSCSSLGSLLWLYLVYIEVGDMSYLGLQLSVSLTVQWRDRYYLSVREDI